MVFVGSVGVEEFESDPLFGFISDIVLLLGVEVEVVLSPSLRGEGFEFFEVFVGFVVAKPETSIAISFPRGEVEESLIV